jgi:hypothetical protein
MRHLLLLLYLCVFVVPAQAQVNQEQARGYFKEAAELCEREGGRLWGVSLCGPMVFADAATGTIATNQDAPAAPRPPALGFVNAPINWGGTQWAAYVWSMMPADDPQGRRSLLLHELFHRVQQQLGLMTLGEPNDHLDTLEGRYWLRLEWRALARAAGSSGNERIEAIRDALAFRANRRTLFAGSAEKERVLEIREGLAQYTGTAAAALTAEEAVAHVVRQLEANHVAPTYVRTFAYPSGAAYGVLLDAFSPGWTRRLKPTDDLGQMLMQAAKVQPTLDIKQAVTRYDRGQLRAEEEKRDAEQQVRIAELRRRFVEGPMLIVPRGKGASLITTGSTPIPGEGTVFLEYRTTGEWGSLESKGILESSDNVTLRLPGPFTTDSAVLTGNNWKVTVAAGWVVRPGSRMGDFQIVRDR